MKRLPFLGLLLIALGAGFALRQATPRLGKQPDGAFVVSSGQRVEAGTIAFDGRPVDLALHPAGNVAAVLGQKGVFLVDRKRVLPGSQAALGDGAGFRGILWSPDGSRLFASVAHGALREVLYDGVALTEGRLLVPAPPGAKANPRPGGMAITRDGKTLFVACLDRNAIAQLDLTDGRFVREFPTQNLPGDVRLSGDEKRLVATNWGGRVPTDEDEDDDKSPSAGALVVVDPLGAAATGTVSVIDRASGQARSVPTGRHPSGIAIDGDRAFVACAADDAIDEIDLVAARRVRTLPLRWGKRLRFGAMPGALALTKETLLVACGGDNAIAEIDRRSGQVRGYWPAGYCPTGIVLAPDEKTALVVNTKGNGSVRRTVRGEAGNAHDFQGTVSVIDLSGDRERATQQVAKNNGWDRERERLRPKRAVFDGRIRHVLYIIKENRTYDEVFGDMKEGNGDPKLCGLGEEVTPNHHALARAFTLFDNGYVSGTNSADGHAWSTQSLANDYLERFYTGYRTYPDDGDCAMSIAASGCLWDAALAKKRTVRVYGEFCDDALAQFTPAPKDWLEMYRDRGVGKFQTRAQTRVRSLKALIHPGVIYWPLLQSDQARADLFIAEYERLSREGRVPNLMILTLPCDHTEGSDPRYPRPRSMVADNDLALGRVVEAVSKSPQWKNSAIFVIEDDAQSGPDHVDGHRTVFACYSPYVRRGFVDSTLYTTVSMLRTIELMLGLDPMNRFDALTAPLAACFQETPDLRPFTALSNRIALDDMNPPRAALGPKERRWLDVSLSLDWSGIDRPDPEKLNRVIWHSLHGVDTPYPDAGE